MKYPVNTYMTNILAEDQKFIHIFYWYVSLLDHEIYTKCKNII